MGDTLIAVFAVGLFECQTLEHFLHFPSLALYKFKYLFFEKFLEARRRDADVYLVVNLNGNARAVAFTYAKAAAKHYFILKISFFNGFPKKLHYLLRAFKVAGASNTNLNDHHILYLSKNFFCKEISYRFGGYGIEFVVNRYANAFLASAHAERAAKVYFIFNLVLSNKLLELLYYLARAFDVARATDTYCNFHFIYPLSYS
jgi:hypothetical protein